MEPLFAAAPGFDQPLAVLKHCHDRIRKQLATLEKLPIHLAQFGADQQAQQAATAVLRYFEQAAPLHHEDEEINLLPMLQETAQAEDQALLTQLLPTILQQHQRMAELWGQLKMRLEELAQGNTPLLPTSELVEFQSLYQEHMQIEETQIAPMAARILSPAQFTEIGQAMQLRRGITTP